VVKYNLKIKFDNNLKMMVNFLSYVWLLSYSGFLQNTIYFGIIYFIFIEINIYKLLNITQKIKKMKTKEWRYFYLPRF
jgi:hypothetical protein